MLSPPNSKPKRDPTSVPSYNARQSAYLTSVLCYNIRRFATMFVKAMTLPQCFATMLAKAALTLPQCFAAMFVKATLTFPQCFAAMSVKALTLPQCFATMSVKALTLQTSALCHNVRPNGSRGRCTPNCAPECSMTRTMR